MTTDHAQRASLRKLASRGGRAIDGGYPFTPVRDNVLLALLDELEAAEAAFAEARDNLQRVQRHLQAAVVDRDTIAAALEFAVGYAKECAESIERPTRTDFRMLIAHIEARAALASVSPPTQRNHAP